MDTSEKYIKMCEAAHEIQSLKKMWDCKDFFEKSNNQIIGKARVSDFQGNNGFLTVLDCPEIWLPRQDQLQEFIEGTLQEKIYKFSQFNLPVLIIHDYNNLTQFKRDWSEMINGVQNNVKVPIIANEEIELKVVTPLTSFEQLWLAFVMKEKYNKTWNEETQKWEENK